MRTKKYVGTVIVIVVLILGMGSNAIGGAECVIDSRKRDIQFVVTADPQFFKDSGKWVNHDTPRAVLKEMVGTIEGVHRCKSPRVREHMLKGVQGVVIAGDLTQLNRSLEWKEYRASLPDGGKSVYDGVGNHDYTERPWWDGDGKQTFCTKYISYSWIWEGVHFIHLNLFPGNDAKDTNSKHDPHDSLEFLIKELKRTIDTSGKKSPVIIFHHYGFDVFSKEKKGGEYEWWTENHRNAYWKAIKDYNVKAIFTGHIHLDKKATKSQWHIEWKPNGERKIHTFVSGAALNGIYLYVEYNGENLIVERMWMDENQECSKSLEKICFEVGE